MLIDFDVLLEPTCVKILWDFIQKGHENEDPTLRVGTFEEHTCKSGELPLKQPDVFMKLCPSGFLSEVEDLYPFRGMEVYEVVDTPVRVDSSMKLFYLPVSDKDLIKRFVPLMLNTIVTSLCRSTLWSH